MMNLQINTKQTSAVARMLGRLLTLVMLAITWTNANAAMWLVGDAFNGWSTSGNVEMTNNNGIYTYTAVLTEGKYFAFFKDSQNWSSQYGPNNNNSAPTGDWESTTQGSNSWRVATSGTYVIEYDYSHDQARIALEVEYYLVGDQMGWNYDDNNKFTKNAAGDTYTLSKVFSGQFKIRTNTGAWYSNGAQITATNNTVDLNNDNSNNMTIAAQDEPYTLTITKGEQYDVLTITGFASTPTPDTYTYRVVGTPTDLWGGTEAWVTNIEGNNMSSTDDEHYSLTKNPVHLTTGVTYGYKVVKINDNTNVVTWIPAGTGNERTFTVSQNGNYNLTINYTVGDTEASHSLTLVQADPDTWTVAGTPASLWGGETDWNEAYTANDMKLSSGTIYTLTKQNVDLTTSGTYAFKVVKNHAWGEDYPSANYEIPVPVNGTYNLTITFNSDETKKVSHSLELVSVSSDYSIFAVGSEDLFGSAWEATAANKMSYDSESTFKLVKEGVALSVGTTYEYKVIDGDTWYPESADGNDNNKTITVTTPGTYNITFYYDVKSHAVSHELQLVQAGAQNTFKVYVRSSDQARAFLYAWYKVNDNETVHFNGTWDEAMNVETQYGNLPTTTLSDNQTWYYLEFDTYFSSYNLIAKTAGGTQTDDINGITAPEVYIVYRPDGTYFYSTQGPSTIDGLYLMGLVGNQKWGANVGTGLTNNGGGTFTINNVSLVENATFSFASRKGETIDDWEGLLPNLFYPAGNTNYLIQEKDMNVPLKLGGRGKAAYTDANYRMEISDDYDIVVNMNDMTVTFKPSNNALYILGKVGDQEWGPNIGMRMRTTDGNIYQRNVTLKRQSDDPALPVSFSLSKKLGNSYDEINEYRIGAVADGNEYWVTDELIVNKTAMPLSADGEYKDFVMKTTSDGHYIMTVNLQERTLTLKRTYVPDGQVVVHVEKNGTLSNPRLQASFLGADYNGQNKVKVEDEYETVDGFKWWTWTVENSISDLFVYEGEALKITSPKRAGEVFLVLEPDGSVSDVTRNYEDLSADGVADCATMLEGHHYVYFTNTPGWENVYVYLWYLSDTELDDQGKPKGIYKKAWPGDLCTLVGYDAEGFEIWMFDLSTAGVPACETDQSYISPMPTGVIFNDGSSEDSKQQSGDFVYHDGACYDYINTIYLGKSLANIIAQGVVKGPEYTVEDELVGVIVIPEETVIYDTDGTTVLKTAHYSLYAKDMNNYLSPSLIKDKGEIDYMFQRTPLMTGKGRSRYDQSNWVKLVISPNWEPDDGDQEELEKYVGKVIKGGSIMANIVNNVNPEMHILEIATAGTASTYPSNLNVYIPASFIGTQPCQDDAHNPSNQYFFVTPKPQEYCEIQWAVYDEGSNTFCMPQKEYKNGHWNNEGNLDGTFNYNLGLNSTQSPRLSTGNAYTFHAIVRLVEDNGHQSAPRRVESVTPKVDTTLANKNGYMVYPIDLTGAEGQIVTGIDRVDNVSQVVETRYIDLQGRVSNMPHSGVNVVVTRYSDGSTTTRKVMF